MKVCYGTPYIEVEFGQRDEGWMLYLTEKDCIASTKDASVKGVYSGGGGYYGPVRPLHYYEIPLAALDTSLKKNLKERNYTHTDNRWTPKFKGSRISI